MRMSRHLGVYARRDWRYLLFYDGKTDTRLTGGLAVYPYLPSISGSAPTAPAFTQGDNFFTLELDGGVNGKGGALFTENALDLTKKTTLYLEVASASGGYITFGATGTKANEFEYAARKTVTSSSDGIENTTLSLDISDLEGSFYLFIALFGSYEKNIRVTKWWIE